MIVAFCALQSPLLFTATVGVFRWNTKLLRLSIFDKAQNGTNYLVCVYLEHCTEEVLELFLPGGTRVVLTVRVGTTVEVPASNLDI